MAFPLKNRVLGVRSAVVVPLTVSAAEQDQEEESILQDVERTQRQQLSLRKLGSPAPVVGGFRSASASGSIGQSVRDAESTSRKGSTAMEGSVSELYTTSNIIVLTNGNDIQDSRDSTPSQGHAQSRASSIFIADGKKLLNGGLSNEIPGYQHAIPEEGDQPKTQPGHHQCVMPADTVKAAMQSTSITLEEGNQPNPGQHQCDTARAADPIVSTTLEGGNQPNPRQHQRVMLADAVKEAVQSTSTTLAEDELLRGNGVSLDSNSGEEVARILQWFRTVLGQVEKKGKIRLKDLKQAAVDSEVKVK